MADFGNLNSDEYHLLYMMALKALQKSDTKLGILESLDVLRDFLKASDISLYKKFDDWQYAIVSENSIDDGELAWLVNMISETVENKTTLKLSKPKDAFKNAFLIYLPTKDSKYMLVVKDYDYGEIESPLFLEQLINVMNITLNRLDEYERSVKAVNFDLMTGLHNRNSYETRMKEMNPNELRIYGLFDLFRLKYINDNYGYLKGDKYIKEVADILERYWPTYRMTHLGEVDSGNIVYRLGGDEFTLLTRYEGYDMVSFKASSVAREASRIDLGIGDVPLGLNYGLAAHNPFEPVRETIERANKALQKNKSEMYKNYGLERRK